MALRPKSPREIERMRAAGRIVHNALQHCRRVACPGMSTAELDAQAARHIRQLGGEGLFKGYPNRDVRGRPFPGNVCISVNDELVHGIPGPRILAEGDVISVDCGVRYRGWCADAAITWLLGPPNDEGKLRLCRATAGMLDLAIRSIRPGVPWSQVAAVMQQYAEQLGYHPVSSYIGHGIGRVMHEPEPPVPSHVDEHTRKHDFRLVPGLVLAIEPVLTAGNGQTRCDADDWTIRSRDETPAAHFEHTVAVTHAGGDVLTDGR